MTRLDRLLSISFVIYLNFIEYVKSEITNANSAIPTVKEHDILQAIKIPFQDPKTMYFDQGLDGFPAFGILSGSDIKVPHRLSLPEKLYPEFSITCTVAVKSQNGGFIFAVVNPMETVVEFGIQVHPVETHRMNISLFYTDIGKFSSSKIIGSFLVPYSKGKFIRFAIQVTGDSISLFHNCQRTESLYMKRDTSELLFDPASTLYIGQAGPIIKGNFEAPPPPTDTKLNSKKCASLCQSVLNDATQSPKESRGWEWNPLKWMKSCATSIQKIFFGKNSIFHNMYVKTGNKSVQPQRRRRCRCFCKQRPHHPPPKPAPYHYPPAVASGPRHHSDDSCCFGLGVTYIPDADGSGGELTGVGGGAVSHSHGDNRRTSGMFCCFSAHVDDSSGVNANPGGSCLPCDADQLSCPFSCEDVIECAGSTCCCAGEVSLWCVKGLWKITGGLVVNCLECCFSGNCCFGCENCFDP